MTDQMYQRYPRIVLWHLCVHIQPEGVYRHRNIKVWE